MTAALKAINGSAGAPSITFTTDATTGMYLISSGNLGLSTSGILAATFDSFQVMTLAQFGNAKLWTIMDTADASTSANINTLATSGTGAITIGTSTNWATSGYMLAGNEFMAYTLASATSLTIAGRGQLSTVAVSHATGSTITPMFAGLTWNNLILPARTTANRPQVPNPGSFGYNTTLGGPEYYNGSVWVSSAQPNITPQGYLSPTAGTPIITGDATSQGTIYYNPYQGNLLPVPNAGVFTLTTFSTASITLSASQAVNGIYDIYAFTTSGNLTFGISPSWSAGTSGSVTPGSCLRGTGTGGAALTQVSGFNVNATTMTLLNGVSSYSIATASGLYLGSIFINPATAGTVNLHRAYGQSRQWGIWNAFNRVPIYLKAGDNTATWTYTTNGAYRPSNSSTANSLYIFSGLAEDVYNIEFAQYLSGNNANATAKIAVGVNSSATASGMAGNSWDSSVITTAGSTVMAVYESAPLLGLNQIISLEQTNNSGSVLFNGTEASMLLLAKWKG